MGEPTDPEPGSGASSLSPLPRSASVGSGEGTGAAESGARPFVMALALALPALATFAVCLVLAGKSGGFAQTTWYPLALLEGGVLAAILLVGRPLRLSRLARLSIALLAAFAAWSYLTILWADAPGQAWNGANLTLFYLIVFTVTACWPVSARSAAGTLLAFAAGLVVLGAIAIAHGSEGDPNAGAFIFNRLSEPTEYPNATAALFGMGAWVTLTMSLQPWLHRLARGAAVGLAIALVQLDLLAQSRGAAFTTPLVLIIYFILARHRVRAAVPLMIVALATVPAIGALLDAYNATGAVSLHDAVRRSAVAIGISAVAGAAAAVVILPLVDRLPEPSPTGRRALRIAGLVAVVLAVAGTVAIASPTSSVSDGWRSFKHETKTAGSTHFTGLGSNRYDFWRVGLDEFQSHPMVGIGVDNFAAPYIQQRQSDEQPEYPHSLVVKILSQTGLVGAGLLLAFIGSALAAALARGYSPQRGIAAAGALGFLSWLAHASVDWLWELPATGAAAFALLGVAVGVGAFRRAPDAPLSRPSRGRALRLGAVAGVVSIAILATVSLGLPWLSARYEEQALSTWQADPALARATLERAAELNPLNDQPFILQGAIASRAGDYQGMRRSFEHALDRNGASWYSRLELAVALSQLRDFPRAASQLALARRLNPDEQIIRDAQRTVAARRPIEPATIDKALYEQFERI